jgi:5-methylcytosine-specific restriction endonuclease McrA
MTDNKLTTQVKQEVRLRAKSCCEYCHSQEKFATHSFSVEHIQPLSKGGDSNLDNIVICMIYGSFRFVLGFKWIAKNN